LEIIDGEPRDLWFWIAAGTVMVLVPLLLVLALHGINTEHRRVDDERADAYLSTQITADISHALDLAPGDPRTRSTLDKLQAELKTEPDQIRRLQAGRAEGPERLTAMLKEMAEAQTIRVQGDLNRGAAQSKRNNQKVTLAFVLVFLAIVMAGILAIRYTRLRTRLIARVRAAAARSQAIFDSAMDAIVTLSPQGRIETINTAGEAMFGYGKAELIGRDMSDLLPPPPGEEGAFLARARLARSRSHTNIYEMSALRKDGSPFQVDMNLGEMDQTDGLHLVAVLRDATERRRTEQAKSEFIATVSHELRTPLTSIAGSLGLLLGGAAGPVSDKAAKLVKIAESNSRRLVRLINDILDIEKIASGQVTFVLRSVDLTEIARRALDGMAGFTAEFDVTLDLETPDGEVRVQGDADRLTQVFANLLSNAAKFSPRGGRVRTVVNVADGHAHFCVEDKGIGIPLAFRERIFGKFAQADSSDTRKKGGTGLGLAISKEIVERHGGRIWFESALGMGATFHVEMPLHVPAKPMWPPAGGVAPANLPLVLHVDDDPDLRQLVSESLMGLCRVQDADSLQGARSQMRLETPRLAILDLVLPDGSGLDLLPDLVDASGYALPVVMFTAHPVKQETLAKGVVVLTKSRASLEHLGETVSELLGGKTA
jgi:PAS domain S-box-containing protein